jgi:hypothetical protein
MPPTRDGGFMPPTRDGGFMPPGQDGGFPPPPNLDAGAACGQVNCATNADCVAAGCAFCRRGTCR